jgi:hypothetical protein
MTRSHHSPQMGHYTLEALRIGDIVSTDCIKFYRCASGGVALPRQEVTVCYRILTKGRVTLRLSHCLMS